MKPLPDWGKPFRRTALCSALSFSCSTRFCRSLNLMVVLLLLLLTGPLYAQPTIEWDNDLGGTGDDRLTSLQQTSDGGYILGGASNSPVSGDKTEASKGNLDFWVVKLDKHGNKVWDRTFGGSAEDQLTALQQTKDGAYILGGYSNSPISGDKTQASRGGFDYWVVKLDKHGNKVWDRTFGGSAEDQLADLQQTKDGCFILGGWSNSPISGDKTAANKGNRDFWVVKLDKHGNKQWDRTFGGSGEDQLTALRQSKDECLILGGYSNSPISGDKTQASRGGFDYWVVKLDKHGNKQWDRTFGGSADDRLFDLEHTKDGGFILGGLSSSGVSGDKTEALTGCDPDFINEDIWIVKLDKHGNKEWDRNFGHCPTSETSAFDRFAGIATTKDGGYLIGGFYNSALKGPCAMAFCYFDYWVIKVDAAGVQEWEKTIGGRFDDFLADLQQTRDGGFILGGSSNSPASADKTDPNVQVCEEDENENVTCFFDYWVVKLGPLPKPKAQQVKSFTLINAETDQPIRTLHDGDEINLADLPTHKLNIRANTHPDKVGSVKFWLSGKQKRTQLENEVPYALFGDTKGDYNKWYPPAGSYTLKATPYSKKDGQGTAGTSLTIHFKVIKKESKPRVESFSLIYSRTGQVIQTLKDGDVINLADLASRNVNVVANTHPDKVGSVRFRLSGKIDKKVIENEHPYALYGDFGGRYKDWYLHTGSYQLSAMAYTAADAKGTAGEPLAVHFKVVYEPDGMAAARLAPEPQVRPELGRLTLYPNPTPDGRLQVQLAGELQGQVRYSLLSPLGSKLAEGSIDLTKAGNLLEFDFSAQIRSGGVYYLRLEGADVQQVFKIMRR